MNEKKIRKNLLMIIIVFLIIFVSFSGCLDEKSRFIGTWGSENGSTTMTFNTDNTVNIVGTGPLGIVALVGKFDYTIANQQITLSSGGIGVTLNYSFSNSNTLILTNAEGASSIFTKT